MCMIYQLLQIINLDGFSREEKLCFVPNIRQNLIDSFTSIISAMMQENFSEKFNQELADRYYILSKTSYPTKENRANLKEMKKLLSIIIKESGFWECLARSHHLCMPDNAEYFISKVSFEYTSQIFFFLSK